MGCFSSVLALSLGLSAEDLKLPDPLTMKNGAKVTSAEMWRDQRRPELLDLFRGQVYGRAPLGRPESLKFTVTETDPKAMDGKATRKQVSITYSNRGQEGTIRLVLFLPNEAKKPAPCFLLICNRGAENIDPTREKKSPFWPAEQIIARGYAAASFLNTDIAPDKADAWKSGAHAMFDPSPRLPDTWGTIGAWAWGASRVMDYLETDAAIDKAQVALVGHSRGGKTALWAGAQDERFALVVSNESGCTGAKLARHPKGESIKAINTNFPHWFCENYKSWNDRHGELPVDQHELIALIAPRPVYVASASKDTDPEGEFLGALHASSVYKLFGLTGLAAAEYPQPDTTLQEGCIAYHLRPGPHNLLEYDWSRFMDFADKHFQQAVKKESASTHQVQTIEGWTLHISQKLLGAQPEKTARAIELLRGQLAQLNKVTSPEIAARLQKVPLWFNPAIYKGASPRAEYHPDAGWLRDNHRDPAMAEAVEFTNIPIFEEECRRMPMLALHELAHAFHHQVLGHDHAGIIAAYEQAKKEGQYNEVQQWTGRLKVKSRAYALANPQEYFAETSEAFFGKNDFQPFDREELKKMDPVMCALLEKVWTKAK